MKDLYTYLECDATTPGNTMGMGNPGETAPGELSEPIGRAFAAKEKIDIDEPDRKKKKKKRVKSLAESLFDDNIKNQLTIEKILPRLRDNHIQKLSREELEEYIKFLFELGDQYGLRNQYSLNKLKNHPVDTFKHVIIVRFGEEDYIDECIFVFSENPESPRAKVSARKAWIDIKGYKFYWAVSKYGEFDNHETWEDKCEQLNSLWIGRPRDCSVLPEKQSQDLIKCILGK